MDVIDGPQVAASAAEERGPASSNIAHPLVRRVLRLIAEAAPRLDAAGVTSPQIRRADLFRAACEQDEHVREGSTFRARG
jgi:hypothetical protein